MESSEDQVIAGKIIHLISTCSLQPNQVCHLFINLLDSYIQLTAAGKHNQTRAYEAVSRHFQNRATSNAESVKPPVQ